jgi:hypothetical protein
MSFDIVILVGPQDLGIIHQQIKYTQKNVRDYRQIYIIACDPALKVAGCTTVCETQFPFQLTDVAHIHGPSKRNGWYFQQLLKLYAGTVITDILPRYLVIDCDTFFLKPTTFVNTQQALFNQSHWENHAPYYRHMQKVLPGLVKAGPFSWVTHHMLFEQRYLQALFQKVESVHGKTFWQIFLNCVEPQWRSEGSGASEYELYGNFMWQYYRNAVTLRPLNWKNVKQLSEAVTSHSYVSVHYYNRVQVAQPQVQVAQKAPQVQVAQPQVQVAQKAPQVQVAQPQVQVAQKAPQAQVQAQAKQAHKAAHKFLM